MIKRLKGGWQRVSVYLGVFGILAASLSGCGGGTGSPGGSTGGATLPPPTPGPYTGRAACSANPHQSGRARWTILIYMQAANNLQPYSLENVAQMASVGSDSNINIVLQWKQIPASKTNNCPNCNPSFYGVRRYLIHQHSQADINAIANGDTRPLNSDRLPDPPGNTPVNTTGFKDTLPDPNGRPNGTEDMGSYQTLADFVRWGTQTFPADNVALVIWDHGSGWLNVYRSAPNRAAPPNVGTRAVAEDDEYTDEIETWELPQALAAAAQPIDMLILDCSLEQMTEVAYEVRHSARIMVGSEESPPAPGYPYDKWLGDLKASGGTFTDCDLGNAIIHEFVNDPLYVNDTGGYASELTQSMIDLSQMDNVASALDNFGAVLGIHVNDQQNLFYRLRQDPNFQNRQLGGAQHYTTSYRDNKDLWDYAELVRTGTSDTDMQQAAIAMENALTGPNGAILEAMHGPTGQDGSHGLAIYVPAPSGFINSYYNLAITRAAPHWPRFLLAQVK